MRYAIYLLAASCLLPGAPVLAGSYDSTNGVFGAGSYVGSDHWFASFTQSALLRAAARRAGQRPAASTSSAKRDLFLDPVRRRPAPPKPEGAGRAQPGAPATPALAASAPALDLWVRPQPDQSWKRPMVGAGFVAPQAGPGLVRPQVGPGYQAPQVGPGYVRPQVGPGFVAPQVGPGYVRPGEAVERADAALRARDLDEAVKGYREAAESASREEDASAIRASLGAALLAQGHPSDAARELSAALDAGASDPVTRLLHGAALLFQGDAAGAARSLSRCPGDQTDGMSDLLLGIALDRQRQTGPAMAAYRRYLGRTGLEEVRRRVAELAAPSR